MSAPALDPSPQAIYEVLMAARQGDPVEEILARIIASWSLGIGAMPRWLGLGQAGFERLLREHFPRLPTDSLADAGAPVDERRLEEIEDLRRLLLGNLSDDSQARAWMVEIVIAGCMGDDHLWQDLGLWSRSDLSRLMQENFAPLAARNTRDMKWKKFLYKQLCETEGIYTCRAPSCEVCADYAACYGPEE